MDPNQAVPVVIQHQHAGGPPVLNNESPARIRTALEFLGSLSFKTMKRVYNAGDGSHQFIEVEGQSLTNTEKGAQDAAHTLLTDYFNGELKADVWEASLHRRCQQASLSIFGGNPCLTHGPGPCPEGAHPKAEGAAAPQPVGVPPDGVPVDMPDGLDKNRGYKMPCPVCMESNGGEGFPGCGLCKGAGRVMIFPDYG